MIIWGFWADHLIDLIDLIDLPQTSRELAPVSPPRVQGLTLQAKRMCWQWHCRGVGILAAGGEQALPAGLC